MTALPALAGAPQPRIASAPLTALALAMVVSMAWLILVFVGSVNQNYLEVGVQSVDPATGTVVWSARRGATEAAVFAESSVLIVTGGGVEAIGADGHVRWRYGDGRASGVTAAGVLVYVTTTDVAGRRLVVALDEATGRERWRAEGELDEASDGVVVLKDDTSHRVLTASSGELIATWQGRVRDATAVGGVAAALVKRSLRTAGVGVDATMVAALPNGASIAALTDRAVVLDLPAELPLEADGPRPRSLVAYDPANGNVLWRQIVAPYDGAAVAGTALRLEGRTGATKVDLFSGHSSSAPARSWDTGAIRTVDGSGSEVVITHVERLDEASAATDYYILGVPGHPDQETTIAVDADDGAVRWAKHGVTAAAAGDGLAVLDDGESLVVVADDDGRSLAVLEQRRRYDARVVGGVAVLLSNRRISAVDTGGIVRTVRDGLEPSSHIVGSVDDTVLVDHLEPREGGRRRRILTAYRLSSGDVEWSHRIELFRSTEMVGSTLVVTGRRAVTEIDVATGVATVTPGTPPYPREEMPAPARLVAGFDATLSRLLWLSDLAYGEWRFGLVDGVVVFVQHVRLDIQTDMTRPDTAAFD